MIAQSWSSALRHDCIASQPKFKLHSIFGRPYLADTLKAPCVLFSAFVLLSVQIVWAAEAKGAHRPAAGEENFQSLFSPQALQHWRQCGPGHFSLTNGIATGESGMGLWWYSARQFTNFVLRGEFMQEQEIADSGVFVRFPDPKTDPWNAVHQGHEIEIGDPNPKDPTWRTGSIYPFEASSKANTRPVGQWNRYEITCTGQKYSVSINGERVTSWIDPKGRTTMGYIGLQNYNDGKTVRHRNLRIRELP